MLHSRITLLILSLLYVVPRANADTLLTDTGNTIYLDAYTMAANPFVIGTGTVIANNIWNQANVLTNVTLVNNGTVLGSTIMQSGATLNVLNNGQFNGGLSFESGTLTNQVGASISQQFGTLGTVYNAGTISGTIYMGGRLYNEETGVLNGNFAGVQSYGNVLLQNNGLIQGAQYGLFVTDNQILNNGVLTGAVCGAYVNSSTIINNGLISGDTGIQAGSILETSPDFITNNRSGQIIGTTTGIHYTTAAALQNYGAITGGLEGIHLDIGGDLNNSGNIYGGESGIFSSSSINFTNSGIVNSQINGLVIFNGFSTNYIVNLHSGIIRSDIFTGVDCFGVCNLDNYGIIGGGANYGVLADSGAINNYQDGVINGSLAGLALTSISRPTTLNNQGTIWGTNYYGVQMTSGFLNNQTGGFIAGKTGVSISGATAVYNAGTIIGTSGTAIDLSQSTGRQASVTLDTGSIVIGNIVGGQDSIAVLLGHGAYTNDFSAFSLLNVYADSAWALSGSNVFSSSVNIHNGGLVTSGYLASPQINISSNAFLSGRNLTGNVQNDGLFLIQNNTDISGNLNTPGLVYFTSQTNILKVTGSASLGGSLYVSATPAPFDPTTGNAGILARNSSYALLTAADGINGTFDQTQLLMPSYSSVFPTSMTTYYNSNAVEITITRAPFASVAQTSNQKAVARSIDGVGVTGLSPAMATLVNSIYYLPSSTAAQNAFNSLNGNIYGTMGMLDLQQQRIFNSTLSHRTGRISENPSSAFATPTSAPDSTNHLVQTSHKPEAEYWMQGMGSFGSLDGDANAPGGSYTITGVSGGLDYQVTPSLLVGAGVGWSHNAADVGGPGASGNVDAYQLGAYTGYKNGPWRADGILSIGLTKSGVERYIDVGAIQQKANSDYYGGVLAFSTEEGYIIKYHALDIEPVVGINYAHLEQGSFSESGQAGDGHNYGLRVSSIAMDSLQSVAGLRCALRLSTAKGIKITPEVHAFWSHEMLDCAATANSSLLAGGQAFNVTGVAMGLDSARLGGGLTIALARRLDCFVQYEADCNAQMMSSTCSGGFKWTW